MREYTLVTGTLVTDTLVTDTLHVCEKTMITSVNLFKIAQVFVIFSLLFYAIC